MGIYFGNLDRELADRQNVIKEDAARQYRGSRDMMESFSDLGKTVERGIKDYSGAKLDAAKLKYNVERNKKSDEIRSEQHMQSTKRNKELSLDSQLKNIERFRVSSVSNHIGKQWYWRDPKAVRAAYDDRMKVFTADDENIDPAKRMKLYPHLFGKKAMKKLGVYDNLLKTKAAGVEVTDEQLEAARNELPLAPMNFMDWAKDGGLYNKNIKGNPGRAAGAMQTLALQNAGYNIPNVTELDAAARLENGVTQAGNVEPEPEEDVGEETILNNLNVTTTPRVDDGSSETTIPIEGEGDFLGGHYSSGVWTSPDGTVHKINSKTEGDGAWSQASGSTHTEGEIDQDELFVENIQGAASNTPDIYGSQTDQYNSPGNPFREVNRVADKSNSFEVFKKAGEVLQSWGVYGKSQETADRLNQQGKAIGGDVKKMMESRDREELAALRGAVDYKDLPAYKNTDSWVNLSKEEKTELLQHPAIEAQGASPEKVFNFEKAKEELSDKDHEIFMLHNPLKKYSPLKDPGSSFNKLAVPTSTYGGMVGGNAELISLVKKYNALMPLRVEERKKLLTKRDKAERSMDASKTQGGINESPMYLGAETTDNQLQSTYGNASDYGVSPAPIRPQDTSSSQGIPINNLDRTENPHIRNESEPLIVPDLGVQAAVRAEQSDEFQKEMVQRTIELEGRGVRGYGDAYFDGKDPITTGNYAEGRGETLTLSGGLNIYGTINSMPIATRKKELEEVATNLFGKGGIKRKNFLRFMNMKEKDHKKNYKTRDQREKLRLSVPQQSYLTDYMLRNHLDRLVKKHPYLNNIAEYPKEMQVFLMDNTFNMGPNWLKKFKKLEGHLRNWVDSRSNEDLELIKKEYKDSDHYREKTRAQNLVAMI